MRFSQSLQCAGFPCRDVRHECFYLSDIELDPQAISLILISEAAAPELKDNYFAGGDSLFEQTTLQAFHDAGMKAGSFRELTERGIYFTSAVKCGKTGYGISTDTIRTCSLLLEKELALFSRAKVWMLMGDTAIKAVNAMAKKAGAGRAIPAGSTYKIRGGEFFFQGKRLFPSYLQAGPSFFIEKSKRKTIAQDLEAALRLIG